MSEHGAEKEAGQKSRLRKWAEGHPEGGDQLAYRCSDYDHEPFWEFSIWLDWTRFGVGIDAEREYGTPSWADRMHFAATLGPVTFSAVRTWNDPQRTRITPPAETEGER